MIFQIFKYNIIRKSLLCLFGPLILFAIPTAAEAQQTNLPADSVKYTFPEVIVTARRYEESYQRVPLSLTVFDPEQLQRRSVSALNDLTLQTPNLNIFPSRSSSSTAAIFIRGIGQEDNVFTVDAGVGIYLDDVLLPRAQGALLDIYDVERIEILRGPQGTLYGRNTIAGAIKYISKRPTNDLSTQVEFATGNYKRIDFKGIANFPIIKDRFLTRFSVGVFNREGFELNTFTNKRVNSKKTLVGCLSFLLRPIQSLQIEFRADGVRERPSIHVGSLLRPQTTALDFPGLLAQQFVTIPVEEPFRVRANVEDKLNIDTWGLSSTVLWDLNNRLSLRSVSSYRELSEDVRFDFDATEARGADVFIIHDHEQVSQEFQLTYDAGSRGKTVGGFFFFHENDDQFDGTDATAKGFSLDAQYNQKVISYAAYCQTNYKLADFLSLTGGIRITHEIKEFSRQAEQHRADTTVNDNNLFGGFGNGPGGKPPSKFPSNGIRLTDIRGASENWNAFTPRLGLEYQWSDDAIVYASVARGFKSGGFNGRANETANTKQGEPYAPEFVWTYELGAKTTWFNSRLLANAALFYNDYTDLQLSSFSSADTDGDGVFDTYLPLFTNAGQAITQGFELELAALPFRIFKLFGTIGFTDSKYKKYQERGIDLSKERVLPNAPEWTVNLGGSFSFPIANAAYMLEIGSDVNYLDERFLTVSNLPDLLQPDYTIVNAFVNFRPLHERWRITIGGKNLTNTDYLVAGLDASNPPFGIVNGFYGDPRTWTVTAAFRF